MQRQPSDVRGTWRFAAREGAVRAGFIQMEWTCRYQSRPGGGQMYELAVTRHLRLILPRRKLHGSDHRVRWVSPGELGVSAFEDQTICEHLDESEAEAQEHDKDF